MEEYVLRGNSAILKCHIPSFVSEYVIVTSWIISEDNEEVEIKLDSVQTDGTVIIDSIMALCQNHLNLICILFYWQELCILLTTSNVGLRSIDCLGSCSYYGYL